MRQLVFGCALVALFAGCRQDAYCLICDADGGGGASAGSSGGGAPDGGDAGDGSQAGEGGVGGGGNGGTGGAPLGCEPLGDEVCNSIDDDCDGRVDEDFDFATNPLHCGGCDQICQSLNAETACQDRECVVKGCLSGFVSLDEDPGCEYQCPVSPPIAEDCNAIDDDCDGRIDEDLVTPTAAGICNRLAGTPCANIGLICAKREGQTTWYCGYPDIVDFDPVVPNGIFPDETRCDGEDNDCDGVADDAWPELGKPCSDGKVGVCADGGKTRCASNQQTTECDFSQTPDPTPGAGPDSVELCNGLDDNCDGIVDNSDPSDPKRILDDMVHVQHSALNFYIYKYEASRPDASPSEPGISDARSCSKLDAQPWSYVSYDAASSACANAGLRLCTPAEWEAACEGAAANVYPYVGAYDADKCNGTSHDAVAGGVIDNLALATGKISTCVSQDGAFDMSGNLKEWTNDPQGMTTSAPVESIYVVRGGSYLSPQLGLTCQTALSQASESTLLPNVGFRCCSTLPQ